MDTIRPVDHQLQLDTPQRAIAENRREVAVIFSLVSKVITMHVHTWSTIKIPVATSFITGLS